LYLNKNCGAELFEGTSFPSASIKEYAKSPIAPSLTRALRVSEPNRLAKLDEFES
jgi:hypothetical protein